MEILYPSIRMTKMGATLHVQARPMGPLTTTRHATRYCLLTAPPILWGLTLSGSPNREPPTKLEPMITRVAPGCTLGHRSTLNYG